MVKYAVIANLKFEKSIDMARMIGSIPDTSTKPTWGDKTIADYINTDGKLTLNIETRFDSEKDMDEFFAKVKEESSTNGAASGSVLHKHLCYHDETPFRPCKIIEENVIENVPKG